MTGLIIGSHYVMRRYQNSFAQLSADGAQVVQVVRVFAQRIWEVVHLIEVFEREICACNCCGVTGAATFVLLQQLSEG